MPLTLTNPVEIAPNLEPGVRIGDATWVTIAIADRPGDEQRTRFRYTIMQGKREHIADDLQSGNGFGKTLAQGLESLLAFLGAAGESYRAGMDGRESENADLFPAWVSELAYLYADEIEMIREEIAQNFDCIRIHP